MSKKNDLTAKFVQYAQHARYIPSFFDNDSIEIELVEPQALKLLEIIVAGEKVLGLNIPSFEVGELYSMDYVSSFGEVLWSTKLLINSTDDKYLKGVRIDSDGSNYIEDKIQISSYTNFKKLQDLEEREALKEMVDKTIDEETYIVSQGAFTSKFNDKVIKVLSSNTAHFIVYPTVSGKVFAEDGSLEDVHSLPIKGFRAATDEEIFKFEELEQRSLINIGGTLINDGGMYATKDIYGQPYLMLVTGIDTKMDKFQAVALDVNSSSIKTFGSIMKDSPFGVNLVEATKDQKNVIQKVLVG